MPRHHKAVAWFAWQLWFSPATAKLHNAALHSVPASQSQAPLCPAPLRALRVKATGVMQNCLRSVRSHSRRRFPVVGTPYAPPAGSLLWLLWHRGIGQALRAVFWSVACGQSCCVCPAHPVASPLRGIGPALVCPSAPRGLPQPSAKYFTLIQRKMQQSLRACVA